MSQFPNKLFSTKIQLVVIVVLTVLAYSNIFSNKLVIDDVFFIKEWPQMQNFDIPSLLSGSLPDRASGVYRPVRSILYAFYYQIGGDSPFVYHTHSLLVHLAVTILVYLIVKNLLLTFSGGKKLTNSNYLLPFVTALFFGLHPIHTEEITYISASLDATGIMFMLASFYLYIRKQKTIIYSQIAKTVDFQSADETIQKKHSARGGPVGYQPKGLHLFFAFLAFFTNEFSLILPLLIILYEIYFLKFKLEKKYLFKFIPITFLAVFYLVIRLFFVHVGFSRGDYIAKSFYHTIIIMPKIFMQYIFLLMIPLKLSFYHTIAPGFENYMVSYSHFDSILKQTIFDPDILFGVIFLFFIFSLIFYFFKKQKIISFCISWFFITMLPVSYIVPVGPAISERYLYLSSFAFCLMVGYLLFYFFKKNQFLLILIIIFISSFYMVKTYQRNRDWLDSPSLYLSTLSVYPDSLIASYHLAVYYYNLKQFNKAISAYQKVIEVEPNFYEAHANLANSYLNLGMEDKAEAEFQKSISINPNFLDSYIDLALLHSKKNPGQSIEFLQKALLIDQSQYKVLGIPQSSEEINFKFSLIRQMLKDLKRNDPLKLLSDL